MYDMKGKVALVTGASRGIGRAIALELSKHGTTVVVNYNKNESAADEVVGEISRCGSKAMKVQADVSDYAQVQQLMGTIKDQLGGLDILVNNAGISRDRTLRRMSPDEWSEVLHTNLDSVFYCLNVGSPLIIERGGGRVVNISSIQGQSPGIGVSNYATSKAGIIGLTKASAMELARYNVTVNAVCPGFVETELIAGVSDEVRSQLVAKVPMGRFGQPEEVASIVRYLIAEGDYITGQCFNINGGMYM